MNSFCTPMPPKVMSRYLAVQYFSKTDCLGHPIPLPPPTFRTGSLSEPAKDGQPAQPGDAAKHAFRDYTTHGRGTGIYLIDDRLKISIAGDWGTGTDEARIVAAAMEKSEADFTIHLGDVYYVGDSNEVRENFLGEKTSPYAPVKWPMGSKGSFAVPSSAEPCIPPKQREEPPFAEWAILLSS
jgi:hypothetical protein